LFLPYIAAFVSATETASHSVHSVMSVSNWLRRNLSPVKYELAFYIPEDDILHSHRRENLKSSIALTGWTL
jgi:hypothetical protein